MSLCSDGLSSDQYFLVNFIMSNYLGPDVYSYNPRCSASQRLAKGLPPYTLKQIGSSSLNVTQLQSLYYYVLRNAESSLLLNPNMIYLYLKGYLPLEPIGKFHQFTTFFPTNLHPQKRYSPSLEIVKGIVLIDDPAVEFISKEELQRFRCLSRLNDLKIDRVVSLSPQRRGTEQDCSRNGEATSNGLVTNKDFNLSAEPRETCKRKKEEEAIASCVISKTPKRFSGDITESQGMKQDCSRNKEETSNGLVTNKDFNSSAELRETCKKKKEEEAIANCVISKTPKRSSGDITESQGMKQDSSRNKEETSNGLVANQEYNSSAEPRETCKKKKEKEEAIASCVISKTPKRFSGDITESQGMKQDYSRNEEETSNGLVANQEYNSSVELRETCKKKKEEEAVGGHAVCVISNTPERSSGDIPESQVAEQNFSRNGESCTSKGLVSDQGCNSSAEPRETCKRKKEEEEAVAVRGISKTPERFRETYKRKRFKNSNKNGETPVEKDKTNQPISLALVPVPPETTECDPEPLVITTGTASQGTLGPSAGIIDIGVNKVAYFFQVALPGVCKDYGEFSCEIESDGKVTLEGSTTTGKKTIKRYSRVFKMNTQNLCPPGPFKLCFNLPGPVDPRLFSPNFRSDGIFEAVIIRHKKL